MQLVALAPCPRWCRSTCRSASTPSTRQEQTSRPSTVTLQAPQSPVAQPSLVPVSPSWSRRHVEQRLLRLAQELDSIAVDGRGYVMLSPSALPRPFERNLRGAPGQHARDLDAIFLGAALVVDRLAGGARRRVELLQARRRRPCCRSAPRRPAPPAADVGATAPSDDARGRARAAWRRASGTRRTPTTAMSISVRGMKRR